MKTKGRFSSHQTDLWLQHPLYAFCLPGVFNFRTRRDSSVFAVVLCVCISGGIRTKTFKKKTKSNQET